MLLDNKHNLSWCHSVELIALFYFRCPHCVLCHFLPSVCVCLPDCILLGAITKGVCPRLGVGLSVVYYLRWCRPLCYVPCCAELHPFFILMSASRSSATQLPWIAQCLCTFWKASICHLAMMILMIQYKIVIIPIWVWCFFPIRCDYIYS